MFCLQSSQMLKTLEKSLKKHLPESLKVYGTVFHMNQGNPFKLKALVDKWPDFNTVVIRPQEQDMTDDFDHYTNTYLIYSKDPKKCQGFLGLPEVINWKQHLQIQSSQSSLDNVIENLTASNLGKVKHTQCFLYMIFETAKKLAPFLLDAKNLSPNNSDNISLSMTTLTKIKTHKIMRMMLNMVMYTFNPSTWEVEVVGSLRVQGHPETT